MCILNDHRLLARNLGDLLDDRCQVKFHCYCALDPRSIS